MCTWMWKAELKICVCVFLLSPINLYVWLIKWISSRFHSSEIGEEFKLICRVQNYSAFKNLGPASKFWKFRFFGRKFHSKNLRNDRISGPDQNFRTHCKKQFKCHSGVKFFLKSFPKKRFFLSSSSNPVPICPKKFKLFTFFNNLGAVSYTLARSLYFH